MFGKFISSAAVSNRKLINRLKSDAADVNWPMTVIASVVQTASVVAISMGLGCLAVDAAILGMMTDVNWTVEQISPGQFEQYLTDTMVMKFILGLGVLMFGALLGGFSLTRIHHKRRQTPLPGAGR